MIQEQGPQSGRGRVQSWGGLRVGLAGHGLWAS